MQKYKNKRTEYNGRTYDSQKEAQHAATLDMLKRAADPKERVVSWEPQPRFKLEVNGVPICAYVGDFQVTFGDGRVEIQDVKGEATEKLPVFKLKKKLMQAVRGIEVVVIK